MPLADFEIIDVLWIALSAFLVVVGLAGAYLLLRLSGTARRLTLLLQGIEASVLPLVNRVQGTVDRLNHQLDKADRVTTSLVDGADAADTAVRAVTMAITRPVTLVSGLARGVSTGISTFMAGKSVDESVKTAQAARAAREEELERELAATGPPPGAGEAQAGAARGSTPEGPPPTGGQPG